MNEKDLPPLVTVVELRRLVGRERLGREAAYRLARKHGVKLGKRYLLPRAKVIELLEGRLVLDKEKTAR